MSNFPVPLENLFTFVEARHPDGDPLVRLSDAVFVATQLNDEADALLGHYVDQARRAGATWSSIGESMGVSKQAAQKRFVPRLAEGDTESGLFSRFTPRANAAIASAAAGAQGGDVDAAAIVLGSVLDPDGLAARAAKASGVTIERLAEALGSPLPPVTSGEVDLTLLPYDESAKELLRGTLRAVLRLKHNYVGTEHLLLGALMTELPVAQTLGDLGLTVETVENAVADDLARIIKARG